MWIRPIKQSLFTWLYAYFLLINSMGTFLRASRDHTGVLDSIEEKIAKATKLPRTHYEVHNCIKNDYFLYNFSLFFQTSLIPFFFFFYSSGLWGYHIFHFHVVSGFQCLALWAWTKVLFTFRCVPRWNLWPAKEPKGISFSFFFFFSCCLAYVIYDFLC